LLRGGASPVLRPLGSAAVRKQASPSRAVGVFTFTGDLPLAIRRREQPVEKD